MDCTVYRVKDYQESHTFRIEAFSKLAKKEHNVEIFPAFSLCGVTWQMSIYLSGFSPLFPNSWSVYLENIGNESVVVNLSVHLLHPLDIKESVVQQFNRREFKPNVRLGWNSFTPISDAVRFCQNDCITFKVSMARIDDMDLTCSTRFDLVHDYGISVDSLAQSLAKMATDPAGHDTTLVVGLAQQDSLQANRFILMARSPVFHAMFSTHMQESERGEVHIPDFEAPVVRELLHFMYTDCLTQDTTVPRTDLLCISTKYQVQGMMCLCENLLLPQINEDSAAPLLQLADQQGAARLKQACLRFVAQNADKVTKKRTFQELDQELKDTALLVVGVVQSL